MPQIFQVLRCYKCFIFQIHQTKKNIKWQCKLCGEKQSIKRHYGIGTGKDCRMHVQKLNIMQAEKYSPPDISSASDSEDETNAIKQDVSHIISEGKSKWSNYIDENEVIERPIVFNNLEIKVKKLETSHSSSKINHNIEDDKYIEGHNIVNSMLTKNIKVDDSSQNALKAMNSSSPSTNYFDQINPSSKWANFVELKENCITDSDKIKNKYQGLCSENNMKEHKKVKCISSGINSCSKWANFIDSECNNTIQHSKLNESSNKQKDCVKLTQSGMSPNINTSAVDKTEQNNPQNLKQNKSNLETFPSNVKYHQSFFSLSDEQDLDRILDI